MFLTIHYVIDLLNSTTGIRDLDWDNCKKAIRTLNNEDIKLFAYMLDWSKLYAMDMGDLFLMEFANYVDWTFVCNQILLSKEFLECFYMFIDWRAIVNNATLTEKLVMEFIDEIDLRLLCQKKQLSESFVRAWYKEIGWDMIFGYQKLQLSYVVEHEKSVHWMALSTNEHLTYDIYRRFEYQLYPSHIIDRLVERHIGEFALMELTAFDKTTIQMILGYV